jgi:hypothetical protein
MHSTKHTARLLRCVILLALAALTACQHYTSASYVLNAVYRTKVDAVGSKSESHVCPKDPDNKEVFNRLNARLGKDPDVYRVRKGTLIRVIHIWLPTDIPGLVLGRFESGPEKGREFNMRHFWNGYTRLLEMISQAPGSQAPVSD